MSKSLILILCFILGIIIYLILNNTQTFSISAQSVYCPTADENKREIIKFIKDQKIKKQIFVPNKLLNIII